MVKGFLYELVGYRAIVLGLDRERTSATLRLIVREIIGYGLLLLPFTIIGGN